MTFLIIIWPLLVSALAAWFNRKQNSAKAWTGGPISWPKSFWLAYTTSTWFFFPFVFIASPDVSWPLKSIIGVHLLSWWLRGPLELVMIYKWFNWSPRYGISHDVFHLLICGTMTYVNWDSFQAILPHSMAFLAMVFIAMVFITTSAEILFAVLFLLFRTHQEAEENIYFASDDPKWILINRVTLSIVIIAMVHLLWQSLYAWNYL